MKVCDWTIAGADRAAPPPRRAGWVTLPAPPAQPQAVGSTDVSPPRPGPCPRLAATYVGTGSYTGQVRVLVHTQRWTSPNPATFSTWGNLMTVAYDAP